MRLLIIGGTRFVGRALVDAAVERRHEVTLFNRGRSAPHGSPGVESIHGDRTRDLARLRGRRWDAVVDTCGYLPRHVRASVEALADSVEHYAFISSISVYADFSQLGLTEDSELRTPPETEPDDLDLELYGELKVGCERAVQEAMADRALIVRPGLIVGPHDYMDRFPYWVRRIAAGGEVLAPGDPERQVQLIDARDLGEWIVRVAEERRAGIYSATGPARPLSMREMLEGVRRGVGGDARFTWVSPDFLQRSNVGPWEEMPFWVPEELAGILTADISRAVDAGLTFRSLEATARDTWAWYRALAPTPEPSSGLAGERERELLREWRRATPG